MGKFDSPRYDKCREWIQLCTENKTPWEEIRLARKSDVAGLKNFLRTSAEEQFWPELSVDEWTELVDEVEEYESKQLPINFRGSDGALFDLNQDNKLPVPKNERSCWQMYKNSLKWKKESISDLEKATIGILRRLNLDTRESDPVKGLVVGHVQSGKTANMEALMAMAADHGWNLFIVLSGTIENLRLQTLRRMQKDLNQESNLFWRGIEHPSKKSQYGERAVDMNFKPASSQRYFTVCLKNAARLRKLIDWIHADRASHNLMKILVIDDEADQASISNTAIERQKEQKERKGINKLIVNLIEDRHYKDESTSGKAQAMNYVMYTATPYANFLNESTPKSLYPKDFIWTLKTSDEYIGPNQIYGSGNSENPDGLDIKRIIDKDEVQQIADIYSGESSILPHGMKNAICWFICATAVMRYWGYTKSISMLIHTSQKQVCHEAVAEAVADWINSTRTSTLAEDCRRVYEYEINRISKAEWLSQFSDYGVPEDEIRDYPSFDKISSYIDVLIDENIRHIKMNEEGDLTYHAGLHLVIDNCSKNGIQNGNDHVRLAYPDPDSENYPTPAPAFIIVGGSTLSRGLTIEGLVSTFFLRASCQADTLMQMGRWFGYRRGYELLPRIWMTEDTINKFIFLSQLEIDLRDDLKKYMIAGVRPDEYGPRLLASPKVSWLRLTSRNHSRNAVPAEMDFSGAKPQTTIFDNNVAIQKKNIAIVEEFLSALPGEPYVSCSKDSLVWKQVNLKLIMEKLLVNKFIFSKRSRVFNEIEAFCEWMKQIIKDDALDKWNVIVAGKEKVCTGNSDDEKRWNIGNYNIGKVNRSKKKNDDEASIDIGVLRALKDHIADVDEDTYKKYNKEITNPAQVSEMREKAGISNIPQLIIYRIYGKSEVTRKNDNDIRENMNFESDIIGIQICVPGEQYNSNFRKKLTVYLPEKNIEDEVEVNA